jgi:hypothetical protein
MKFRLGSNNGLTLICDYDYKVFVARSDTKKNMRTSQNISLIKNTAVL